MEYDKNKVVEPIRMREIFIEEEPMEAAVYRREDLTFGDEFAGPAIVEQFDTTMPIRLAQVHLIQQGREITDLTTTGRAFEHP